MGVRRQAREAALQGIFRCDFLSHWDCEALSQCLDHFSISKNSSTKSSSNDVVPFATKLCEGVIENFEQIDSKLTYASENWSLTRMSRVDRCILRLATFEIAFLDEVPVNVAINEAIEIAKRFGSEESPTFVNGVLDKVASNYKVALSKKIEVINENASNEDSDTVDTVVDIPLEETILK